jgi:hypothetical protein
MPLGGHGPWRGGRMWLSLRRTKKQ